jgi:hypothetical protein
MPRRVQVAGEGTKVGGLSGQSVAQAAAHRDGVLDQHREAAARHDVTCGQGSAASRNAATSTEA